MSDADLKRTYLLAWKTYYSDEHMVARLEVCDVSGIGLGT